MCKSALILCTRLIFFSEETTTLFFLILVEWALQGLVDVVCSHTSVKIVVVTEPEDVSRR